MPSTKDLLKDDLDIVRIIADDRQRARLDASLRRGLETGTLSGYIKLLVEDFSANVQSGWLEQKQLEDIANSVTQRVGAFWGVDLNLLVEILPAGKMLEAEIASGRQLMRAIGQESPAPALPSPSFFDHSTGKIVLSDRYVFTYPDTGTGFYMWDDGIFRTIVAAEAGKEAIRTLRGETGDGYVKMLKGIPAFTVSGLQVTVAAANNYGNARVLRDGGVPVLYRRLLDIFHQMEDQVQITNMSMKTLSEEIGIKTASLFDIVNAAPGSRSVTGALLGSHPEYERKDAKLVDAIKRLPYRVETFTMGSSGPPISIN